MMIKDWTICNIVGVKPVAAAVREILLEEVEVLKRRPTS